VCGDDDPGVPQPEGLRERVDDLGVAEPHGVPVRGEISAAFSGFPGRWICHILFQM
jgi:hypothetical protein